MKAVIVDDEPRANSLLSRMLSTINYVELVQSFENSAEAWEYISKNTVDVAFLDVEMPGMTGVELATKLLALENAPAIIFVTAYLQYSLNAWNVGAADYVLKPYRKADICRAIERAAMLRPSTRELNIEVRCFPSFSLHVDGESVPIRNKKAMELLAFLVHNRGDWVDTRKAVAVLFEDEEFQKSRAYYNTLVSRLRKQLAELGVNGFLETDYGKCRVVPEMFRCDYYEYIAGNTSLFAGAYLEDYSWAEPTSAAMENYMNGLEYSIY